VTGLHLTYKTHVRLVEDADLQTAKELFGGKEEEEINLDEFIPKSSDDYALYGEAVARKVLPFDVSEVLVRRITQSLTFARA
jgi:hypothetical protein